MPSALLVPDKVATCLTLFDHEFRIKSFLPDRMDSIPIILRILRLDASHLMHNKDFVNLGADEYESAHICFACLQLLCCQYCTALVPLLCLAAASQAAIVRHHRCRVRQQLCSIALLLHHVT